MASRQEQLSSILSHLSDNIGTDMIGAVAVSRDGIVLAAQLSGRVDTDRLGAVAATMLGVTKRASGELKIGAAEEAILRANQGLFMVLPAGEQSVLAINLRQGANLGLVRIEARDAASAIGRVI